MFNTILFDFVGYVFNFRIFLLARSNDAKKELLLAEEVSEYHDIIQGDFQDSFRNLTIKDIMFLRWMKTYCSQVKFIFKVDYFIYYYVCTVVKSYYYY